MTTKFKVFENKNIKEPEVGDWVLMTHWWAGQHLHKYIDISPCEVISKKSQEYDNGEVRIVNYKVKFGLIGNTDWLVDNFDKYTLIHDFTTIKNFQNIDHWIKYIFKDREEAELFVVAKQYNL